jgi:hypothetical protein
VTLYQTVHDAIHAKSGQGGGLKLQYIRTEKESIMGWVSWSRHDRCGVNANEGAVDHAAFRAVYRTLTATAEERGCQRGECHCTMGEARRAETVLA